MIQLPPLIQIAEHGGLTPRGRQAWSPCPVCGAQTRGRGERRGPLSFQHTGTTETWKCWAGGCSAGGDALGLLAALRYQEIPPKGDPKWHMLFMELKGEDIWQRLHKPKIKTETPPPDFPPHDQIQHLWNACVPLDASEATRSVAFTWLAKHRKLDPLSIAALHLARILPPSLPEWPAWIPTLGLPKQKWLGIYRLVTPLYDATGLLRALRFRAVDRWWREGTWMPPKGCHHDAQGSLFYGSQRLPKALSPRGGTRGLVMADPIAQSLLAGQRQDAIGVAWDGWVLITEGEPDWWAVCTPRERFLEASHQKKTFAAISVEAGSWTPEIAHRIPDGAHIRIWTDHDDAGEKYAATIHDTLKNRCDVQRVNRPSTWGST